MIARRNLDHGYSEEGDEEQFGRGINCTAASLRAMLVFVDGEDHPMDASSELIELMRKAIGDKHGSASVQIIFENRGVSEEFSQLSQQVRGSIGQVQSTLGGGLQLNLEQFCSTLIPKAVLGSLIMMTVMPILLLMRYRMQLVVQKEDRLSALILVVEMILLVNLEALQSKSELLWENLSR